MNCIHDTETQWSSSNVRSHESFDSWHYALNRFHLKWILNKSEQSRFDAEIQTKNSEDFLFIHCSCDPCSGFRTSAEIANETQEYYGLLLVRNGMEVVDHVNKRSIVSPGDVYLWDTTKPLSFKLTERLKKMTLFIPKSYLARQSIFVNQLIGEVLPAREGLGALINSVLTELMDQGSHMDSQSFSLAANLSLELVTFWLNKQAPLALTGATKELLQKILHYIDDQLSDPDLNPVGIAEACHVSIGYLHRLFSTTEWTVSRWIMKKRLERSKRKLAVSDVSSERITDIADNLGFCDASHYAKAFKREYGMTPSEYRKKRLNQERN